MGESNEYKITSGMTATSRLYHAYFDSMDRRCAYNTVSSICCLRRKQGWCRHWLHASSPCGMWVEAEDDMPVVTRSMLADTPPGKIRDINKLHDGERKKRSWLLATMFVMRLYANL